MCIHGIEKGKTTLSIAHNVITYIPACIGDGSGAGRYCGYGHVKL